MAFVGLLDTNILSAIMRDADGTLRRRVRAVGADAFCTSVIVASELRFGAERTQSLRLTREVEAILEAMPDGSGVATIDGKMQDDATWKQARVIVDLARLVAKRDPELAAAYGL